MHQPLPDWGGRVGHLSGQCLACGRLHLTTIVLRLGVCEQKRRRLVCEHLRACKSLHLQHCLCILLVLRCGCFGTDRQPLSCARSSDRSSAPHILAACSLSHKNMAVISQSELLERFNQLGINVEKHDHAPVPTVEAMVRPTAARLSDLLIAAAAPLRSPLRPTPFSPISRSMAFLWNALATCGVARGGNLLCDV